MKILILSCDTGEGHNSAGNAIKDYFERHGVCCDMLNALSFFPRPLSSLISKGPVFVYRKLPKLFGVGYRHEEKGFSGVISRALMEAAGPLHKYLVDGGYDVVLCVHTFTATMMKAVRRRYGTDVAQYFVATDYTCSPGAGGSEMDAYFIPRGVKEDFIRCGLAEGRLVETGIPVQESFYQPRNRKAAREELGFPQDSRILLLMCGSMGCGPIEELVQTLGGRLSANTHLVVVCGSNERLYSRLMEQNHSGQIHILGFTRKMNQLMAAADLFLSKPGGLSSTEAMVKRLPMICINAVPGCETRNLEFFLKKGYATTAETVEGLSALALDLLDHPEKTDRMLRAIEEDFSACAVESIYQYVMAHSVQTKERQVAP